MAQITVTIHNRAYQVACEDGQELHVQKLAAYIDRRVTELAAKSGVPGPSGQVTESRLLVMAALLIADELGETYDEIEAMRRAPPKVVPDPATVKAAEDARSAASASKAQLVEAEAATRNAQARLAAAESRATQAEAALAAAAARAEEAEAQLRTHGADQDAVRAMIATLTARADEATAGGDHVADGLDALAGRIEAMAERLERAAFR
ncbi:MAG TPA: cell division protein ZapA [Alphaproteobacteria bacterium]|nr:cell division protein ZapA [Alphaproteobacteria bacterium]